MDHWWRFCQDDRTSPSERGRPSGTRVLADGGEEGEEEAAETDEADEADAGQSSGVERSNVDVVDAGEATPVDPKWEKPDPDDIPEVQGPKTRPADRNDADGPAGAESGPSAADPSPGEAAGSGSAAGEADPTAGMPNTARAPGTSRIKEGSADGFVVALELCARLPDDVRLPEEAADLVPVALEAELEQTVQQFAGEQFENPSPHVETLDFVEVDGDVWFRLRLGVPPDAFVDLDPEEIKEHALQKLEGML